MSGHGHRFNPEKASKLLEPQRKQIITPEQVFAGIQENFVDFDKKIVDLTNSPGWRE